MGKGKSSDEAQAIKNSQIAEELELPPVKVHCSILAEDAIKAAIADYKAKKGANNFIGLGGWITPTVFCMVLESVLWQLH